MKILHKNQRIGDLNSGVLSAGIFSDDQGEYVKTDAMAAADVLLFSMVDYYGLRKTQGISESVANRLLLDIKKTIATVNGEDQDVFSSFKDGSSFIQVRPGLHQILPLLVAEQNGLVEFEQGAAFSMQKKQTERRIKITSRNLEMLLSSRFRLLFNVLYETISSGYYISTKAHRRLEKVLSSISTDSTQSSVFEKPGAPRFVNLADFFSWVGFANLSSACREGCFDFISSSSSKSSFKMSSVLLSALAALSSRVSISGSHVSVNNETFEFEEDISGKVKHLSSTEVDFVKDVMLLSGASTSLRMSDLSISSHPFLILCSMEVCHE